MFYGVVINPEHVPHQFLTEREQTYNLRQSAASRMAAKLYSQKLNHLMNVIRAMYKHSY